jgi:hypothetical protein
MSRLKKYTGLLHKLEKLNYPFQTQSNFSHTTENMSSGEMAWRIHASEACGRRWEMPQCGKYIQSPEVCGSYLQFHCILRILPSLLRLARQGDKNHGFQPNRNGNIKPRSEALNSAE